MNVTIPRSAARASKNLRELARPMVPRYFKDRPQSEKPRNLLLDVPRSALPTDVLRALKEARAVSDDFPLSSITPAPLGQPHTSFLTINYHVAAPSPSAADEMYRLLSSRPLFAASSVSARIAPSSRPQRSNESPRVAFVDASAQEWCTAAVQRLRNQSSESSYDNVPVDVEWALLPRSGRRVLIRGLPGKIGYGEVRHVAKGLGVVDKEGVMKLPPAPRSLTSMWVITTDSVRDAYHLARRLNRNYYHDSVHGTRFPMRASVIW